MTTQEEEFAPPRLFVSYSWSGPEHVQRVLNLATELRRSGVDVTLDKWDLKEGHDANAFMEQMVTEPTVKKVILICDKRYAERTNERAGGVGAEAQIISGELYEKQAQDKFAAIVFERDEEGQPYLPAYYKGRIYIDLSDPGSYSGNFDQLLRWIFDRPLHEKPDIGPRPSFATGDGETTVLVTAVKYRRAVEALRQGRNYAMPAASEYLLDVAQQFEALRLNPESDPFDDAVVNSIEEFLSCRNELIDIFLSLAAYSDTEVAASVLHKFFEQLLPFLDRPEHVNRWHDSDFDNYRFIIHELFLYAVAAFIHHGHLESAAHMIGTEFYSPRYAEDYGQSMVDFGRLKWHVVSLEEQRNKRLQLGRASIHADFLRERCKGLGLSFGEIIQADFILFLRSCKNRSFWWPRTLLFTWRASAPFEIFARSKSSAYFSRVKTLLGIDSKDDLASLIEDFRTGRQDLPSWNYHRLDVPTLLGFDQIATAP